MKPPARDSNVVAIGIKGDKIHILLRSERKGYPTECNGFLVETRVSSEFITVT